MKVIRLNESSLVLRGTDAEERKALAVLYKALSTERESDVGEFVHGVDSLESSGIGDK